MTFDVLCGREQRNIRSEVQGALQYRGQKCVVDRELNTGVVGYLRDCRNVCQLQRRVCRRLNEYQPGIRSNRSSDCRRIRGIDERSFDSEVRKDLLK